MNSTKNWAGARYDLQWSRSFTIDAVIWLVPAAIIVVLACMMWRSTHRLDPYRPDAAIEPFHVDVVAQRLGQHGRELEASEPCSEDDDAGLHRTIIGSTATSHA